MRRYAIGMHNIPLAIGTVYSDRRYQWGALGVALLSAVVLGWAVQLVTYSPASGLFCDVTPLRLAQVLILASVAGLLIPMQVYVLLKGRQMGEPRGAGKPRRDRSQIAITALGGGIGAALGVACIVCCAPLLIPAALMLLGTTGMTILSFNVFLAQWSGWLFIMSLVLGFLTLLLMAHNVTAACRLNPVPGRHDPSQKEDRIREGRATERSPMQKV